MNLSPAPVGAVPEVFELGMSFYRSGEAGSITRSGDGSWAALLSGGRKCGMAHLNIAEGGVLAGVHSVALSSFSFPCRVGGQGRRWGLLNLVGPYEPLLGWQGGTEEESFADIPWMLEEIWETLLGFLWSWRETWDPPHWPELRRTLPTATASMPGPGLGGGAHCGAVTGAAPEGHYKCLALKNIEDRCPKDVVSKGEGTRRG